MCLYRNTSATTCFSLTELEMFTASSPSTSVCTGGTPSASSVNGASWVAANAFDGVKTGDAGWASATVPSSYSNYPEWLMYDFGAGNEKEITSFAITSRSSSGGYPQTPLIFQMEWSDNGTDWVNDYLILTTGAWTSNDTRSFNLVPIQTAPLIPHTLVAELPNVVFDIKYVPRGRGRLAGIARTDIAAVEDATIRVFDSATGILIDTTKSNGVGAWQFDNLKEHVEHFITASHPLLTWENVVSSQRYPVDPAPLILPRAEGGERADAILLRPAWTPDILWTPNGVNLGWNGYSARVNFPKTASDGSKVRLTISAGSVAAQFDAMYIGRGAAGQPNFSSAPTQVTVGGSGSFTVPASSSVVSDEITFDPSGSQNIIVSFDISAGDLAQRSSQPPGYWVAYKVGAGNASDITPPSMTESANVWGVTKIEIYRLG